MGSHDARLVLWPPGPRRATGETDPCVHGEEAPDEHGAAKHGDSLDHVGSPGRRGCGGQSATSTPSPKATSAIALATATVGVTLAPTPSPSPTPAPTPTPTPRPLVINDPAFVPDVPNSCDGDIQIKGVNGTTLSVGGTKLPMINSKFVVFCYGAKHTWIGTLTYAGYTFASDATDPLQFEVVQDQGYVYTAGTGTVTSPDGSVVTLPN